MDNAPNFASQLMTAINKTLGVKQVFITPYNSQGNGHCKKMNKEIQSIMTSYLDLNCDNWDSILPFAVWGINSTPNERNGISPYQMLFSREPPILDSQLLDDYKIPASASDFILDLQARLDVAHKIAQQNRDDYKVKLKERFDKGMRKHTFRLGDLAVVYDPIYKTKAMKKFSDKYSRPHRVVELISDSLVRLDKS